MDSILTNYGGKSRIARKLAQHFPITRCYVEPFFGGGSVMLALPEHLYPVRVINDLNKGIVTFYRVLRTRPDELLRQLELTPYAIDEQRACRDSSEDPDPSTPEGELELARRVWVRQNQNFGARQVPTAGWRRGDTNYNSAAASSNKLARLHEFARAFHAVEINNTDAVELVEYYGRPNTMIYLDPPYVTETRGSATDYLHEMDQAHHEKLAAAALKAVEAGAHVAISGYDNKLYDSLYKGWRRAEYQDWASSAHYAENHARTEVLWMSYPANIEAQNRKIPAPRPKTAAERALLRGINQR